MIVRTIVANDHASPTEIGPQEALDCQETVPLAATNNFVVRYVFFKCRPTQFIREQKVPFAEGKLVHAQSPLGGKRCLVLDDEFLIALDIQQILELAGAAPVVAVATATEAIELVRRGPKFDVAVLDVKLTDVGQNSLGVATLLAEKGTPFVFLTGMRVDNPHAKQFPKAPVIEKPYDALALLDAVRRALTGS